MQRIFILGFTLTFFSVLNAQFKKDSTGLDSKYLEDQFYAGLTYNLLLNKPEGVTQRNLSYGLQGGFIKDIPVNNRRNVALGLGLGYALNSYYTNLGAIEDNGSIIYSAIADTVNLKRNKIETHLVEVPIEFRWRNSTSKSYKFWRIYTGVKLGYVFTSHSKFVSDEQTVAFSNPDIRKFQYGLTLNFGYNTFNIHAYYALRNLFNDDIQLEDGTNLRVKPLRIGFIFYIL